MNYTYLTEGLLSSCSKNFLLTLLNKQLSNFFLNDDNLGDISLINDLVIKRLKLCISGVNNKYYIKNNEPFFNHLHSGQYLTYLYLFSNECFKRNLIGFSEKLYYLNKIMHSCDIYPAVNLPKVFFLEHPVGTVLGRAHYGENFMAMQGCTVEGNKNIYPKLGRNIKMYSNSKIIGNSVIGDNVMIGANTYIKDTNIPSDSIVFGQFPDLIIKKQK